MLKIVAIRLKWFLFLNLLIKKITKTQVFQTQHGFCGKNNWLTKVANIEISKSGHLEEVGAHCLISTLFVKQFFHILFQSFVSMKSDNIV